MDKKTLLAFLIIAIIILLYPAYNNLLYPPAEHALTDSLITRTPAPFVSESPFVKTPVIAAPTQQDSYEFAEEKYVVETDLYIAEISSRNGGSFISFLLKKYAGSNSEYVQLIDDNNKENLLVSYRSVDGENINFLGPWEPVNNYSPRQINTEHILTFRKASSRGYVYKTLTFIPDNYIINVQIDLSRHLPYISQGIYEISWDGGLPLTEKNKKDDLNYFNAYIYTGEELHSPKVSEKKSNKKDNIKGKTLWAALRTKYFISALIPDVAGLGGKTSGYYLNEENEKIFNISISLSVTQNKNISLYLGPLEYKRIKAIGLNLDSIMNFGWVLIRPIAKGVHYLLTKMHIFIPNYGVVLILFSILVKIVVYPLTKKSHESTQKMQAIQPQLNTLKEKYKNNQQKMSQAQMALFKEHGVNPLGGCFPILLQMPLLFSLFQVFRSTIELRGAPFVLWITDLSAPDTIINLPFTIPVYGDHIAVLPILMGITMFIQQKMMPTQAGGQQKFMSYFMTGFFVLLFNNFSSGLNLYYTLFNVLTILQQKFLTPHPKISSIKKQ
ncbi:MAG: membrane protein insertase YidC [Candidatus Marinimicrobia bacterium]|nr:membrane protein insertase YidC [Candidatus Neomarinimicrobiota bacterium]